ncbi:30S ribosomal protein S8 [Candidatus Roizmanbacteria bacterium RIFCSPHIGHO2_02_FULL_40_13b]|uniref:Small ribosomal subunit protein uS8 n=1 Tax=Candidatus Roizmanbacteria bacterium RIFCSPHIGHO2_01_FULL_39_24 TaxID=1802032 RepID=A0A1F7GL94_9BACT|nr:MAG: 30S ribosomal protein S8 [Candidatus Roizmanbacteria bacterium RIFCSPHIGHO2_01_FULL_39_24]OGK27816.1 MAG: 30S ribosomal protein S8 [Candidatus Roizmanbacteria bacterium RIFCSPHIGHO2_02_FULL_40_13b]OGK49958.1 MAG: 30S ribosomal protein S8 [Candidatus Roizmanbacteria bacterium RIFCSPLOWO2_01_FULL_40_32]OGK55963.1 MAG: 30S ribosomal protein S8 [Candidatus Roizmanbacteria bacterium RIFCSPLOWO2_02_FULL_39_8]
MIHQASDLPIRLKNGYLAKKPMIVVAHSKGTVSILELLKENRYISEFEIVEENNKKAITVTLLYTDKKPAITNVKIISKPGRRIYNPVKKLQPVLGGMGMALISTPQGIVTDTKAREVGIGGEVLFYIW